MHPQLDYQWAMERGRELQREADADRLARSVRGPGERWWRGANATRSVVAVGAPPSASPENLGEALDEIGRVVDALGNRALHDDAAPVVQCLVEAVLQASKEAGLVDLPNGPRPGEPAIVGYRTLAKIGSRISTGSEVDLGSEDARQIGFAISELRAFGRPYELEPLDRRRPTSIARRIAGGRILRLLGRGVTK